MTFKVKKLTLSASLLLLIVSARLAEGQPQGYGSSATGGGEEDEYDSNDDADEAANSLEQRIRNYTLILLSRPRAGRFQEALERNIISEALSVIHEEQTELTESLLSAQRQQQSSYHDSLGALLDFRLLVGKLAELNADKHFGSASAAGNKSTGFSRLHCNESSFDYIGGAPLQSAGPTNMPAVSQSMASVDDAIKEMKGLRLSPQSAKEQSNAEQSTSQKRKATANQEKDSEWYPSCRNSRDESVEWFITVKRNMNWTFLSMTSGLEPYYRDLDIRTSGPVRNTLRQALKGNRKYSHIVITYNNQPPDGTSTQGYAHAKGVVMFDTVRKRGFWIVHSVPNFPDLDIGVLAFPKSARIYAQSFGCSDISDEDQFRGVIAQLKSMNVPCYGGTTFNYYPERDLPNGQIVFRPLNAYLSLVQLGIHVNRKIFQIAKVNGYKCCIYCKISQYFQANMLTETWIRSGPEYHVPSDIKVFEVDFGNGFRYSVFQDHSKWSVSDNSARPYVCVGDLNRHRTARGGGVLCIENRMAQKLFCNSALDENGHRFQCV